MTEVNKKVKDLEARLSNFGFTSFEFKPANGKYRDSLLGRLYVNSKWELVAPDEAEASICISIHVDNPKFILIYKWGRYTMTTPVCSLEALGDRSFEWVLNSTISDALFLSGRPPKSQFNSIK